MQCFSVTLTSLWLWVTLLLPSWWTAGTNFAFRHPINSMVPPNGRKFNAERSFRGAQNALVGFISLFSDIVQKLFQDNLLYHWLWWHESPNLLSINRYYSVSCVLSIVVSDCKVNSPSQEHCLSLCMDNKNIMMVLATKQHKTK